MATGENDDGENLIAKAGRNGDVKRQKLPNKAKWSDIGSGGGGGGGAGEGAPTKQKRAQYCTICKNHNQRVLKKRHKCPHSECQCPLCQLSRRVQCIMCHQQRLWRFRKSMEKNGSSQNNKDLAASTIASPSSSSSSSVEGDYRLQESAVDDPFSVSEQPKTSDGLKSERHGKQQVCDKCRNHEEWVPKRGHKGKCPYENCACQYCSFTIKRRDLMKHQQRVRRAQVTIQPNKGTQDFALQQAEGSASSPVEDPQGAVAALSPASTQEMSNNNNANQNDTQGSWLNCQSDEQNGAGVSQVITNDHRLPSKSLKPKNTPFVEPKIPNERRVSPAMSHEPLIPQTNTLDPRISPAFGQEPPISPEYRQEPTTSPVINNEQRFSLENRHELRIPPSMSSKPVIPSPVSGETEISRAMPHEPVMSPPIPHGISSAMSHESKISPAMAQDHIMSSPVPHGISPAMLHEPMISPALSHESVMSPSLTNEPRISPTMSHESRTSLAMSNEPTVSPVISHEPAMSPVMSHEPVMSPSISRESRISSTLSQDHRTLTAMPNEVRISLQNCNEQRLTSANFHEQRISQGMSHESRTSSTVFNEQASDCTTFHQQSVMNNGAAYASVAAETMNTPLNYLKEEPSDDSMLYDSMGDLASSNNYSSPVHAFDHGMNFASDADFILARQQCHPKYGVDPEDLQLRQWSTKDLGTNHSYPGDFQSNNYRGSSLCIPLSQTQQPSLQQHNTLSQQDYYPTGSSNSTLFSPQSVPYGWGNPAGQSFVATPASHTNTTLHTKHAILPASPCQAYVQSPQNYCQGLWWQQSRLGTLERMNSG